MCCSPADLSVQRERYTQEDRVLFSSGLLSTEREIHAGRPCVVFQRGIVGRLPWCKDYTEPFRSQFNDKQGQWHPHGRDSRCRAVAATTLSIDWLVRQQTAMQTAMQYAERYSLPFPEPAAAAAAEGVNLFWWEPTAAPTRVLLNPEGSPLPMVPSVWGSSLNSPLGCARRCIWLQLYIAVIMRPKWFTCTGYPYGWPAWGCVTPLHQGSRAAWS